MVYILNDYNYIFEISASKMGLCLYSLINNDLSLNIRLCFTRIGLYFITRLLGNPFRLAIFALRLFPDPIGTVVWMTCPS